MYNWIQIQGDYWQVQGDPKTKMECWFIPDCSHPDYQYAWIYEQSSNGRGFDGVNAHGGGRTIDEAKKSCEAIADRFKKDTEDVPHTTYHDLLDQAAAEQKRLEEATAEVKLWKGRAEDLSKRGIRQHDNKKACMAVLHDIRIAMIEQGYIATHKDIHQAMAALCQGDLEIKVNETI
jgi:hypothetical protein